MKRIINQTYDEERALYGSNELLVEKCTFSGPADGESAFKESRNITVRDSLFELRYPFWHDTNVRLENSTLTSTCRASFWYTERVEVINTRLHGIKAFRECSEIILKGCDIDSPEFGWRSRKIRINDCKASSEYFMFEASDLEVLGLEFSGKYSFQYVENMEIRDSVLQTKDAFWHTKNVTVYDSVINGEYLAWYSENLKLVRCKISGTQPLCYCRNLILEDCTLEDCDLAFEYSEVNASVNGSIVSVKNPCTGYIEADSIDEIIRDAHERPGSSCEIAIRG